MSDTSFPLQPTPIHVPDEVLDDLTARLKATNWPQDEGNDDGYYGVRRTYLQELVEYWIEEYDRCAAEAAMNVYEHYNVEVGGVPVHFMRKPGVGPRPTPLILSHGWPWTFWHWSKVVDPLADPGAYGADPAEAFDVMARPAPATRAMAGSTAGRGLTEFSHERSDAGRRGGSASHMGRRRCGLVCRECARSADPAVHDGLADPGRRAGARGVRPVATGR